MYFAVYLYYKKHLPIASPDPLLACLDSLYASSINSAPSENCKFTRQDFKVKKGFLNLNFSGKSLSTFPNVTNYIVEILTQKYIHSNYITRYIKVQFKGPKDMLLPGESKMSH